MVVRTGTVCEFPWSPAPGVTPLTPADCTVSYGRALGASFIVWHVLNLVVWLTLSCVLAVQLWRLHVYCVHNKLRTSKHAYYVHYVFGFFFCFFWLLSSFDLYGFWGYVPVESFLIFDEFGVSCGFSNAVMTMYFLHKLASGKSLAINSRLASIFTKVTVVLIWIDWVGPMIIATVDSDNYQVYVAVQMFGGGVVLIGFFVGCLYLGLQVRNTMLGAVRMTQPGTQSDLVSLIASLRVKFLRILLIASLIALACFVNGILSLLRDNYSWTITLADSPDPIYVSFRVLAFLHIPLLLTIFKVPRVTDSNLPNGPQRSSRNLERGGSKVDSKILSSGRAPEQVPKQVSHSSISPAPPISPDVTV